MNNVSGTWFGISLLSSHHPDLSFFQIYFHTHKNMFQAFYEDWRQKSTSLYMFFSSENLLFGTNGQIFIIFSTGNLKINWTLILHFPSYLDNPKSPPLLSNSNNRKKKPTHPPKDSMTLWEKDFPLNLFSKYITVSYRCEFFFPAFFLFVSYLI